jgi:hypothetical protein
MTEIRDQMVMVPRPGAAALLLSALCSLPSETHAPCFTDLGARADAQASTPVAGAVCHLSSVICSLALNAWLDLVITACGPHPSPFRTRP